jgi:hypothetical protein
MVAPSGGPLSPVEPLQDPTWVAAGNGAAADGSHAVHGVAERVQPEARASEDEAPAPMPAYRPALFARFGDLTRLRHDYPLVLASGADRDPIATLSGRVDALLQLAPTGAAGERQRRHILRLEGEIRSIVARRGVLSFAEAWDEAAERLIGPDQTGMLDDLEAARAATSLDGDLVACDGETPHRVIRHLWRQIGAARSAATIERIGVLRLRLDGLVRADRLRSAEGRDAAALDAGVGTTQRAMFDFEAMARLLAAPSGALRLSPARRKRIERTIDALDRQRLVGPGAEPEEFDELGTALFAQPGRDAAADELIRALAIAELETTGRDAEVLSDARLAATLTVPADRSAERSNDGLTQAPGLPALAADTLVCLSDERASEAELAAILAAFARGMPLKVVLAFADASGLASRLAETAMALGDVFVLQTTASHLYAAGDRIQAGLEAPGPALFSVFTGQNGSGNPAYLVAAAALESRTVPAFSWDPSAGSEAVAAFALHDNPQPDRDWPVHVLEIVEGRRQRVQREVAFTPADFALCDPARAATLRALDPGSAEPGVSAIDPEGHLVRLTIDGRMAMETERRAAAWRRLLELESLKTPRVVVVEGAGTAIAAEGAPAEAAQAAEAVAGTAATAAEGAQTAEAVDEAPPEPSSDEPYIETSRCTTCNECTGVNNRMFAYNENQQAYIADPSAGTYRDLVEAAERCQVAIIHPGKPRDPAEPGLEELLARAALFS